MRNQTGAVPILFIIALIGVISFLAVSGFAPFKNGQLTSIFPKDESKAATVYDPSTRLFSETFDYANGQPPGKFNNSNWSTISNRFDAVDGNYDQMDGPMTAHHGADCSVVDTTNPLPAPQNVTHQIDKFTDSIFLCRNHIMTAVNSGYAAAFLTPSYLVDFSQGEASVRFDMSTFKASSRDWVDFWITPFDDNLVLPSEFFYGGTPKNHIQIKMDLVNDGRSFSTFLNTNFVGSNLRTSEVGIDSTLAKHGVAADAARRDTFEIKISKNHFKFCMVSINTTPAIPVNECWADKDMPTLAWDKAVFQIAHHVYNVNKGECDEGCGPNTWHWDNVKIQPAIPFTMIKTDQDILFPTGPSEINLSAPAPAGSFLRFAAWGPIDLSFNGGASWQRVTEREGNKSSPDFMGDYWIPVPIGQTNIKFRLTERNTRVRHPEVWSLNPLCSGPNCPTPAPTAIPTPTPLPTPTPPPPPPGSMTVDFATNVRNPLIGEYPQGVVNWISGFEVSPPWKQFSTNNLGLQSAAVNTGTFSLVQPRAVVSIQAFNGGTVDSTVTLSCSGNTTKTQVVLVNQLLTISTGWTNPCSGNITVNSSNGWNTNFDNLVVGAVIAGPSSSPTPTIAPTTAPTPTPPTSVKPGDVDGNGKVDIFDYNAVLGNFGKTGTGLIGDLDHNGKVDIFDFNIVLSNFGK